MKYEHMSCNFTDVTVKKAEEKLRKSEAKLSETSQIMEGILHHTHMMAVLLDSKFNFIWVNRAYAETCRQDISFFPGKNHFHLYPHKENQEIFQHVVDTGEPFFTCAKPFEFPEQPERGLTYWDWSLIPIKDASSEVISLVFTLAEVTEKIRAEDALRETNLFSEQIVFSVREGIIVYDRDLKYKLWNPFMEQLTGYNAPEITGKYAIDIFPFLEETGVMKALKRALEGEYPDPLYLYYNIPERGKSGWTLHKSFPLKNSRGEITGVIATVNDITEQKKAEEELRKSEKKVRAVADYSYDWENWIGKDGELIWVNPAVVKFTGYSVEECFAMRDYPFPVIYEGDRDIIAGEMLKAIRGLRANDIECRIRCKDGTLKWGAVSYQPIYDTDGNNMGHRSSVRDITERKKSEEELKKSQKLLAEAEKISHSGSWEWNIEKDQCVLSDNWFNIHGIRERNITFKDIMIIAWPEDMDAINKAFHNSLNKSVPYDIEHRIIKQDTGEIRFIKAYGEVIKDEKGKPLKMIGIARDITEKKKADEEKEKLYAQLLHSQKMESVGRMVGGIAHNFNNILGVISGYTELIMLDMEPDNPLYSQLQEILNSSNQAANLVKQLMAYARKQTVKTKILNINELVSVMHKMLHQIIGEDINFIWRPGDHLWNVKIGQNQLEQIVSNLVLNARDAIYGNGSIIMETANVMFDASYFAGNEKIIPGDYVLLSVSDTGTGMSKDLISRIFEPFFTTKEVGKGTGLGLATVYGIIHQNNGFITVYSEEGKGSTFRIYLPRFEADITQLQEEKPDIKPEGGKETVMVTEDEENYLVTCKKFLEKLGYTVITAKNPSDAINLAENYRGIIDLLITDLVMPGMNGRELVKKIQIIRPGLKYIYMSGYPADVIAHHGILEEGVVFLEKPFSIKTIAEKVRTLLDVR